MFVLSRAGRPALALGRWVGVIAAVTAFSVIGQSAHAAAPEPVPTPEAKKLLDSVDSFESLYAPDDSRPAAALVDKLRDDIAEGRTPAHIPEGAELSKDDALVWRAKKDGGHVVSIGYTGSVVAPSAITVVYDNAGRATDVNEQVYREQGENQGRVTVWSNGALRLDKVVSASSAAEAFPADAAAKSSWFQRFADCLRANKVSYWIIAAVTAACLVACSTGALCIPCAAIVARQHLKVIKHCAKQASGG